MIPSISDFSRNPFLAWETYLASVAQIQRANPQTVEQENLKRVQESNTLSDGWVTRLARVNRIDVTV